MRGKEREIEHVYFVYFARTSGQETPSTHRVSSITSQDIHIHVNNRQLPITNNNDVRLDCQLFTRECDGTYHHCSFICGCYSIVASSTCAPSLLFATTHALVLVSTFPNLSIFPSPMSMPLFPPFLFYFVYFFSFQQQ